MSPIRNAQALLSAGFPRVSGDEPATPVPNPSRTQFSPRERG